MSGRERQGPGQIIVRNLQRAPVSPRTLWIDPDPGGGWQSVAAAGGVLKLSCQEYGPCRSLRMAGADAEFTAFPEAAGEPYAWVLLNLPRQKALLEMMLHCAASVLAQDGVLWLAGELRAGIRSAGRHLQSYFGEVVKLDSARHCGLYEARRPLAQKPFEPVAYRQTWQVDCAGGRIEVCSYPGVFAHGRLDAGSERLLSVLPSETLTGDVLDFGAGAGVIGACIAKLEPEASVTFLDSNALALKSCAETAAANYLETGLLASDGFTGVRDRYDVVVSNPPIHTSVRTDNTLGRQLLAGAHDHLRPGGRLILVANVHLPYERWLRQQFGNYRTVSADENYKVLASTRRR